MSNHDERQNMIDNIENADQETDNAPDPVNRQGEDPLNRQGEDPVNRQGEDPVNRQGEDPVNRQEPGTSSESAGGSGAEPPRKKVKQEATLETVLNAITGLQNQLNKIVHVEQVRYERIVEFMLEVQTDLALVNGTLGDFDDKLDIIRDMIPAELPDDGDDVGEDVGDDDDHL